MSTNEMSTNEMTNMSTNEMTNMSTNEMTTTNVKKALMFELHTADFDTMRDAMTSSKIKKTHFDKCISEQLEHVAKPIIVRALRAEYTQQIKKLVIDELLQLGVTASVRRYFDKQNGNSYFSVQFKSENGFIINLPLQYGYGNAENLVFQALSYVYEMPTNKNNLTREILKNVGIKSVTDYGYQLKRDQFVSAV